MTAVRQNRVLTINQETVGSAKDFGVVSHPTRWAEGWQPLP